MSIQGNDLLRAPFWKRITGLPCEQWVTEHTQAGLQRVYYRWAGEEWWQWGLRWWVWRQHRKRRGQIQEKQKWKSKRRSGRCAAQGLSERLGQEEAWRPDGQGVTLDELRCPLLTNGHAILQEREREGKERLEEEDSLSWPYDIWGVCGSKIYGSEAQGRVWAKDLGLSHQHAGGSWSHLVCHARTEWEKG